MSHCPPSWTGLVSKCWIKRESVASFKVAKMFSKKKFDFSNLSHQKRYDCENSNSSNLYLGKCIKALERAPSNFTSSWHECAKHSMQRKSSIDQRTFDCKLWLPIRPCPSTRELLQIDARKKMKPIRSCSSALHREKAKWYSSHYVWQHS